MTEKTLGWLSEAVIMIKKKLTTKVVSEDKKIQVYKVPGKNPDKYIIRIDMKVGE